MYVVLYVDVCSRYDILYFIDPGFNFSILQDGIAGVPRHCCRWGGGGPWRGVGIDTAPRGPEILVRSTSAVRRQAMHMRACDILHRSSRSLVSLHLLQT